MFPRLGRALLIAALLLAQQSAFAHQLWHLSGKPLSASTEQGKKSNPLCDLHQALDTVLGGISCAPHVPVALEAPPVHFPAAHASAASLSAPSPLSRGPPALP